jgi:hypothetical protein
LLGVAENPGFESQYRFDSSKPIGKAVANLPSQSLNVQELLLHLRFDQDEKSSLIDLWETICEQIQSNLADESDDRIFRILMPNFETFLPP